MKILFASAAILGLTAGTALAGLPVARLVLFACFLGRDRFRSRLDGGAEEHQDYGQASPSSLRDVCLLRVADDQHRTGSVPGDLG